MGGKEFIPYNKKLVDQFFEKKAKEEEKKSKEEKKKEKKWAKNEVCLLNEDKVIFD